MKNEKEEWVYVGTRIKDKEELAEIRTQTTKIWMAMVKQCKTIDDGILAINSISELLRKIKAREPNRKEW